MKKRRFYTNLALVLLAIFLAVAMRPLMQNAWIYMSRAVIPNRSTTHRYADHHNLLLSVGGERWASKDEEEEATAYHALVIPLQTELREDGSVSGGDGISHTDTLRWLWLREHGGNYQGAEAKLLTIVYHTITQSISVGSTLTRWRKATSS